MSKIQIINPTKHNGWDNLLLTNENTTFFHTSGWCRVLSESYNYKPLYFTQIDNNKLVGLIATMEVNSFLTGKRGVSLPFTDQCEPMAQDQETFNALLDKVIEYGKTSGWKSLEIRGGHRFLGVRVPSERFNTHILNIAQGETATMSTFRDSTRRNISKSQKSELVVTSSRSMEAVKQFCRLNDMTRKEHGIPPQPFTFFEKIFDHIIAENKGVVILASNKKGDCVAGALFSVFNNQVIFKYGASDKAWHSLRPNNLVMWEAIKHHSKNGSQTFDFGRTDLDHKGLLQFKRGWGATESTLHYYNYDLPKKQFVTKYPRIKTSYPIFKNMPMPLLKLVGRVLYRHMA